MKIKIVSIILKKKSLLYILNLQMIESKINDIFFSFVPQSIMNRIETFEERNVHVVIIRKYQNCNFPQLFINYSNSNIILMMWSVFV